MKGAGQPAWITFHITPLRAGPLPATVGLEGQAFPGRAGLIDGRLG